MSGNQLEVIQQNITRGEQLQNCLSQTIMPALSENLSENLPQFVNTFKEMWSLHKEREMELARFIRMREDSQERFVMLVRSTEQRLSGMQQNISAMSYHIMSLQPQTELEFRNKELLLKALGQLQQGYLCELQMLLNV